VFVNFLIIVGSKWIVYCWKILSATSAYRFFLSR
jgi:hypothetical protein